MEFQHFNVKLFVDGELKVDPEQFIDVFHRWVADQQFDEMLIDVADYRHVPEGPGVLLVGLEADWNIDHFNGRYGLRYNRKAPVEGDNHERLKQAYDSAVRAAELLEAEFSDLKFCRQSFQVFINDRALAPNNEESRQALDDVVQSFLRSEAATAGWDAEALEFQLNEEPRSLTGGIVAAAGVAC